MPIKTCTLPNGKQGYKWGDAGKCYPSISQAMEQARAIQASQQEKKK
jgi:hypothetical protein